METFKETLSELYHRILKEDVDIIEVEIAKLSSLYIDEDYDNATDALFFIALFLLWKSRKLLPVDEKKEDALVDEPDLFSQFLEYSRFKEVALDLIELEKRQLPHIPRDILFVPEKKESGLEEVSLEDLAKIFQKMIDAHKPKQMIEIEEEFTVSSKLDWLKEYMTQRVKVPFTSLFSLEKSKFELISLFLALLELIKLQEISIIKENEMILCLKR